MAIAADHDGGIGSNIGCAPRARSTWGVPGHTAVPPSLSTIVARTLPQGSKSSVNVQTPPPPVVSVTTPWGRSGLLISVVAVRFAYPVVVELKNTSNTLLRWVAKDTTSKAQSGNEVISAKYELVEFLLITRSPLRCGLGCRRVEVVFGPGRQTRHPETAVERHVRIDACIETLINERPRGQGGIGRASTIA